MALLGRLVSLALLVVSGTSAAQDLRGGLAPPAQHNRIIAQVSYQPMAFFVVSGATDSCGRGCSQWIVADGKFERDTAKRFKDFIATTSRGLPVFFHSPGGNLAAALDVARLLREHRMTAGIGRTVANGCNTFGRGVFLCQQPTDMGKLRGALQENAGICMSACVYAFAGASTRRVAPGAILGVHSGRLDQKAVRNLTKEDAAKLKQVRVADVHNWLRRSLLPWGVDPGLQDITQKVASSRIYFLSRTEIDRLGLETRDFFETRWFDVGESPASPAVMKAVTHVTATSPREHGTLQLTFTCGTSATELALEYQRELPITTSWTSVPAENRITAGDVTRPLSSYRRPRDEMSRILVDRAFLEAVSATKMLRLELALGNAEASRLIDVSTAGLSAHLVELRKRCQVVG